MSEANFRKELIEFLVKASEQDEDYYGYINPYLIGETVSALSSTTTEQEPELDKLFDWADKYWSW